MGGLDNLLSGVAGSSEVRKSVETAGTAPRERDYIEESLPLHYRKALTLGLSEMSAGRSSSGYVHKQDVDRRATLPQSLQNTLDENDAAPKPYDPNLLRDLSSSTVPQTYVDTLAQDAASANWRLKPIDEDAEVDPTEIAQVERRLRNLVPDSTFPEFLEEWSRSILRLGDGTVVKHYPDGDPENPVGEIVHIDSATMFKQLDENGFPNGYVQMTSEPESRGAGQEFEGTPLELEEVVWVSWARRGNHIYGEGPVEKGQDTIEVLEEIMEKEILDLVQGMPPGVISRPPDSEVAIDSADWENFKDDMRLNEGERHRVGFAKWPVDYTPLSPNYQEMQLLERYKTKVTELGGVFKVNPSYAGFEFENVNRATDESQRQAYKQRGFQVLISRLEAALTFGVLPDLPLDEFDLGIEQTDLDTPDDMDLPLLRFEFEREQSTSEKQERANYVRDAVEAGKQAANAGLDVRWKDGMPIVEDGEMEEGNAGSGGGDGGLFGSVGRPEHLRKYSDNITEDDLREAYRIAGSEFSATEAQSPVVLTYPPGGVPIEAVENERAVWESVFADLLDAGASAVLDLYSNMGGASLRAYPDALPSDHDPGIAVYGLSEAEVEAVLSNHPAVHLNADGDAGPIHRKRRRSGGKDFRKRRDGLTKDEVNKLDEILFEAHKEQIFPESADDIVEKRVFSSSSVPDYVAEKIEEALDSGSVFEGFENIPDNVARVKEQIEELLRDNLLDEDGWDLREIRDDIRDRFPGLDEDEAETIARTETSSTLNTAREKGYEERDDAAVLVFEWTGPDDSRTTPACEFMKHGDSGVEDAPFSFPGTQERAVPMDELKQLEKEVATYYFPDLRYREHILHPNERHTFKRVLEPPATSSPETATA